MTPSPSFSSVRLIGFAIPTVPADVVPVGDPNGPGSLAGTYRALDDFDKDIEARANVIQTAADAAFKKIPADDSVLNIFVAPEFYWHGIMGPYTFGTNDVDPADAILAELQKRFTPESYPNSLFIFGSVITSLVDNIDTVLDDPQMTVRNDLVKAIGQAWHGSAGALRAKIFALLEDFMHFAHANPKLEVRNRALVVSTVAVASTGEDGVSGPTLATEKYFASNEDFLLWDITDKTVITEQSVAYPVLDLSNGDFKTSDYDSKAIFDVAGIPTAIEICLDHSDQRLRKSAQKSPWPEGKYNLKMHLIPSCGMQLQPESVAATSGGIAFNCDGQYVLGDGANGKPESKTISGVASTFINYSTGGDSPYEAHTQLSSVAAGPVGAYSTEPSSRTAKFAVPDTDVTVIELPDTDEVAHVFAGGAGAVHIYGLDRPLSLPRG